MDAIPLNNSKSWAKRVIANLGPKSSTQEFPLLLKEWYATGKTEDKEEATFECGVCDHQNIRHWFEIRNKQTDKTIHDSGSKCILRFPEIGVMDENGVIQYGEDREHLLNSFIRKARERRITASRKKFAEEVREGCKNITTPNPGSIRSIAESLRDNPKNGTFSPEKFNLLLWGASAMKCTPPKELQGLLSFRGDAISHIRGMQEFQIRNMLPFMTTSQQDRTLLFWGKQLGMSKDAGAKA